ncbi:MAG: hypothetical protein WC529_07200 [Candidatus Margulisiibacteriota bacterium]
MNSKTMNKRKHEKILLFVHIPKTAGTTLGSILQGQYARDRLFRVYEVGTTEADLAALPQAERDKLDCVIGHFPYGLHRYFTRPCQYATLLRDPVDLIVSLYYYLKNNVDHPRHNAFIAKNLTLGQYVGQQEFDHVDNYQVRFLVGRKEEEPVTRADLELAKRMLKEKFAGFGLTERFDESILMFRRKFNWSMPYYAKRNVSCSRPGLASVPEEVIGLIRRYHALDVELYAYAQQLFTERIERLDDGFQAELRKLHAGNRFVKWKETIVRIAPMIKPLIWQLRQRRNRLVRRLQRLPQKAQRLKRLVFRQLSRLQRLPQKARRLKRLVFRQLSRLRRLPQKVWQLRWLVLKASLRLVPNRVKELFR